METIKKPTIDEIEKLLYEPDKKVILNPDGSISVENLNETVKQLQTKITELEKNRDSDLYVEFGDGKVSVATTKDNKIILSKQLGMGKIGQQNPILNKGNMYTPSNNDIVLKFKNIESLQVVKNTIEDIEQNLQ